MRLYLAGPMSNIPEYNFPAFDEAERLLTAEGHTVFNPAANDRKNGFDAKGTTGTEQPALGFDLRKALREDLSWICDNAQGIALLPDWTNSKGVAAELALAHALSLPVSSVHTWVNYARLWEGARGGIKVHS